MTIPPEFSEQQYTGLEMRARNVRNALRVLVWLRRGSGLALGDPAAWATVSANLAAVIYPSTRPITGKVVEAMATFIGVPIDENEAVRCAAKEQAGRVSAGATLMASSVIGRLVGLTATEKRAILDRPRRDGSKMKLVYIEAVDAVEDRRRRQAEAAARRRRDTGQRAQSESLAAEARRLGVAASTLHRRRNATVSSPAPMGLTESPRKRAKNATVSSPTPAERYGFVADPLTTEVGDKTNAAPVLRNSKISTGSKSDAAA